MAFLQFIRNHATFLYFLLAFVISWACVILLAGPANIPIQANEVQDLLPLIYASMLLGPSIGGLLMSGLVDGKQGFTHLFARLSTWRVGIGWYVAALFATPLLAILILLILAGLVPGVQLDHWISGTWWQQLPSGLLAGLMVGFFEELGWTGFIVPRFLRKYNILTTGILVGLLWGAWHFILFWEADSFLGTLPLALLIGRLFLWLPPFRVLMVWIYQRTQSLPVTILSHVSLVVTTTVIVPITFAGNILLIWLCGWGIALWLAVALLVFVNRNQLLYPNNPERGK